MKKEQHIRILVVEPGKAPYATVIENSLEGMQSVVGGYIEYVPLADDRNASLYCNDEGKINAGWAATSLPGRSSSAEATAGNMTVP